MPIKIITESGETIPLRRLSHESANYSGNYYFKTMFLMFQAGGGGEEVGAGDTDQQAPARHF